METLDDSLVRWAVGVAAPGAAVIEVRGLRDGGTPWLVRFDGGGAVVVRVGTAQERGMFETEVAALSLLPGHGLPGPRLLAARLATDQPALVIELLPGSSAIPPEAPVARLRRLGAVAAAIHAVRPGPDPALPRRERPIAAVDFAALRRAREPRPLLVEAEAAMAARPVPAGSGFVHGDLWQGNALWQGDTLAGLIDWDCAGVGPAGVDLGSLRCDAALCFGPAAAGEVLRGWENAAGRPATDVAYWDVVAGLCTPPDMDWFVGAIAGQGRADLTREVLLDRRDRFLADALRRLPEGSRP
jgi:aminoglycoside phosphotransferase (APT) family kinase protein